MAAKPCSGGDDVAAVIVDPGYDTMRIGNCQEDYPREFLSSAMVRGVWQNKSDNWRPLNPIKEGDFIEMKRLLQLNRDENFEIEPSVFEALLRIGIEGSPRNAVQGDLNLDPKYYANKYGGLGLDITQHPMMITEPTSETKQFRDVILEVIFEQCSVPASYLAKRATLSAFSVGRASALVLDVGAGGCIASAVHDGIALQSSIESSIVGGYALDLHLANTLHQQGYEIFQPSSIASAEYKRLKLARELRETFGSLEPNKTTTVTTTGGGNNNSNATNGNATNGNITNGNKNGNNVNGNGSVKSASDSLGQENMDCMFKLPDGKIVDMQRHAFHVPNLLFKPEGAKVCEFNNFKGLCNMVTDCIFESDVDIRRDLASSIVVVGGCTLVPGFIDALNSGLQETLLGSTKFKLVHPSSFVEKRYSTWLGASILASLGRFQQMWISRAEYMEHGTTIAYRRCQ